ncbi:MAG: hypothetical protein DCC67_01485 [Planctomycetota bacterium]|nr:MAG: hypothetical protein DCC67_01485 [Planctomycetota bacterium]
MLASPCRRSSTAPGAAHGSLPKPQSILGGSVARTALAIISLLAAGPPSSAEAADVEAYAGQPFGVARVTVPVLASGPVTPLQDARFTVADPGGRALYPTLREEPVRRFIRRLLEIDAPRSVTLYFLFTGDEPFDVDVFAPARQTVRVAPRMAPPQHRQMLDQWWRHYSAAWRNLRQDPQFPPLVDNFLAVNLARRLNLPLPEPAGGLLALFSPKKTIWDELFASERHQLSVDQMLLAGEPPVAEPAPLPTPLPWYALPAPDEAAVEQAAVESIAAHVPVECFYLRFGNFTNYLWFRNFSRKWQDDLANMIVRRAIDRGGNQRIEQQLSLRESALAQFLGPQVIADVAIIGLDPYLATGGAVGILFQAKANPLLAQDLNTQRRQALQKFPDATETTVRIADHDVSLIASPGGEVRSYYVQDGDFHLVATSRRLVQRFLLAGQGERPLAASAGFIGVRQQLPVSRNDAVFVYVSPEFVRELTSPAIWIESQRRVRSAREIKLLHLARRQAAAEAVAAVSRQQLIDASFLPEGFGLHADGSELAEAGDAIVDSRRGAPGRFVPVADMEVASVTAAEAAAYAAFAERWRQQIGQTPPVAVAMSRRALSTGGETIAVSVLASPLADVKLGRLPDMLGDPSRQRVAPVAGDLIRAEFILDAVLPLAAAEQHHLFIGVRDSAPPLVVQQGRIAPAAPAAEMVRMYVGAWPKPGLIRLLLGQETAHGPDPAPGPRSTWQARSNDFLLISFKPELVREVLPQLRIVEAEKPAQVRVAVEDLSNTQLSHAIDALGYQRTRETALAAVRLMNTLVQQFHVPPEEARDAAERLMDGRFASPLGGQYELIELPSGQRVWSASAVAPQNRFLLTAAPEDFELPLLSWLRGLRAEMLLDDQRLTADVEIDMAASALP